MTRYRRWPSYQAWRSARCPKYLALCFSRVKVFSRNPGETTWEEWRSVRPRYVKVVMP